MSLGPIKKIDEGVWCLESYFLSLGCRGSLRMTILKTQSGLLLYSPVALDAEIVASIRALGTVTDIVAPNQMLGLPQSPLTTPPQPRVDARRFSAATS